MEPSWKTKTDPKHHPVRFLATVWEQRMMKRFGIKTVFDGKQSGQLRNLINALGDLTPGVIEWIIDPINWWHFCQQVQAELKIPFVRDYPGAGTLYQHRGVALRLMHSKLQGLPEWADFIQKIEMRKCDEARNLALVYAAGNPDKLAKVAAAKTYQQMEALLGEFIEDEEAKSA